MYISELSTLSPESAVDILGYLHTAGYSEPEFWTEVAEWLVGNKGYATDLQTSITLRNIFVNRLP